MKILMAGKFVPTGTNPIGGLQSWIKTVRAELERRGHHVDEWQPGMSLAGVYDLGIFANLELTKPGLSHCNDIVCVSHGIIDAEKPIKGVGRQIFTSEGVRDHWGVDGEVVRQPIDLDFWSVDPSVKREWVSRYSYRTAPIIGDQVAKVLRMKYRHLKDLTHEQARQALRESMLVFASGRAALESMACGTPTVIYDNRSAYQGELVGPYLEQQMRNNYSGRGGKANPDPAFLVWRSREEIAEGEPRKWVEKHHDVKSIVEKIVC